MPDNVVVMLASGDAVTTAQAQLERFTPARRAMRAGLVFLVGLAGAAALIPIPIIHLIGIPLMLIVAIVVAMRQLRTASRLSRVRLACPRCGALQGFGGAAGMRAVDAPMAVTCDSCRRQLTLTISPES